MKHSFFKPLAFFLALAIHPALAVIILLVGNGSALGATQTAINAQTVAGILSYAANDREQAWSKKIQLGAYNANVFADNMIGSPGSGKAFIDYTDTRNIRGNTIVLTNVSQLGGEGAQGESERNGNEENIAGQDQLLTVGRQWYGMGATTVATAETIIGSQWDQLNSPLLEQRVGLKKSNDMQMVLRESSTSDNRVFPNGKSGVATLKSADVFQTSVITKCGNVLSSNGAIPTQLSKDAKRGNVEGFVFVGSHVTMSSLYSDTSYITGIETAGIRGSENPLFTGRYSDWLGNLIYPLQIRSRGGKGSVGSPLRRQAFLGIALPTNAADDTQLAGVITGGGPGTTAGYKYFEHFSGYAYKLTNGLAPISTPTVQAGSTLTGDGAGPWYVAIIDKTTGKYSIHSYTGNTGTTLTGVKRLGASATNNILTTVGTMAYSTSAYNSSSNPITTAAGGGSLGLNILAVAQGSEIVEINTLGVPWADTFGLGEQAGALGYGMVPGAGGPYGRRTSEVRDHGLKTAVGYEFSFGCRAWLNVDNVPTNYVRVSHAIQVDGLPAIA